MKNVIVSYVLGGVCEIDVAKTVKKWSLLCRIYKYNNTYRLVEFTPHGKKKLDITISKDAAEYIIEELMLKSIENKMFKMSEIIYFAL